MVHQAAGGGPIIVSTELVTQRPTTLKLILPTSGPSPVPRVGAGAGPVTGPRPTGSVTLYDGSTAIRSIPLSHGNGTIHVILTRGNHDLYAILPGQRLRRAVRVHRVPHHDLLTA